MRMSLSSVICSAVSAAVLAGCSGGADGSDVGVTREPIVPIIEDPVVRPTGSASYAGGVTLGFIAPESADSLSLAGDLALTVNFDQVDDAVTGSASGFSDSTNAYTGALFLNGGGLEEVATRPQFDAQLSGALQSGTDSYLIFGQMNGEVLGTSQEAVLGQITGTARQAGRDAPVSGQFQAARTID